MIEFYGVNKSANGRPILRNITFRILKGEFVYLVGPSGSGKSTVLRLIHMDILPDEGMVIVERFSSAKIREKDVPILRRKIGFIFQDFKLLQDRNVFDNVAFALRVTGAKSADIKRKVLKVLTEVNLGHKRNQYPLELSGGEQQRVAIARALVNNPFMVLADEPTGNLDKQNSMEILNTLDKINRQGTAVLMATHDERLVKALPHRIIDIKDGMIKNA